MYIALRLVLCNHCIVVDRSLLFPPNRSIIGLGHGVGAVPETGVEADPGLVPVIAAVLNRVPVAARDPGLPETGGGRGAAADLAPGSGPGTALSRGALAPAAGLPTAKKGTESRVHTPVPTADPAAHLLETGDRGPPPRTKRGALRLMIRSYILVAPPLPKAAPRTNSYC